MARCHFKYVFPRQGLQPGGIQSARLNGAENSTDIIKYCGHTHPWRDVMMADSTAVVSFRYKYSRRFGNLSDMQKTERLHVFNETRDV